MNALQEFIQARPCGFLTLEALAELVKLDRLCSVLIRCGGCRLTCPAQDVKHLIECVIASGDYVRDLSLPVGAFDRAANWHPERTSAPVAPPTQSEGEDPNPIDDSVKVCPDCERPNQFGELCPSCQREREFEIAENRFNESDCGGVFDGSRVISDADPGL